MKIEGPIYLIKGAGQTPTATQSPVKKTKTRTGSEPADVVRLVQTENQRALLADPDSLAQAKALVSDLVSRIKEQDGDRAEKVHRIDPSLLFRLF